MRPTAVQYRNRLHTKMIAMVFVVFAGACGSQDAPAGNAPTDDSAQPNAVALRVVATTNIVADWVKNIGGDRVETFTLVPLGTDPHGFVPRPTDVTRIAKADLILSVGLGLEADWLEDLLRNAASDESEIVVLGDIASPIELEDENGQEKDDHGAFDPHFWFDPLRVQRAVNEITLRLSALDPTSAETYQANGVAYKKNLNELHAWTEQRVSMIPPERRLLVTSHDSLQYFASAYGFEIVGTVIPSSTTDVEPSAEDMGNLVKAVDERGVTAIFGETTVTERLAAAIANETGAKLVRLYSGSLGGPDSGAESYIAMMRTNVERIVEALK